MTTTRDDTRTAIVERAAALLAEHGPAGVTTRGVAAAAGVQPPTIYRLFGDKDGLLDAVAEHVLATFAAAKAVSAGEEAAASTDPVADLRAGWDAYVDFGLANPTLFTLLTDPVRASSSAAARSGLDVLARRVHRLARAGLLRVDEARAVELVHAAGTGAVLTLLAAPPGRRDRGLADDLRDAVLARVLHDLPGPATSDAAAAAVMLRAHAPDLAALSPAERALLQEWLDRVTAGA
ncbi:TetR/AcrR family transcriptional regulator [Rhodococcus aerolatus]